MDLFTADLFRSFIIGFGAMALAISAELVKLT